MNKAVTISIHSNETQTDKKSMDNFHPQPCWLFDNYVRFSWSLFAITFERYGDDLHLLHFFFLICTFTLEWNLNVFYPLSIIFIIFLGLFCRFVILSSSPWGVSICHQDLDLVQCCVGAPKCNQCLCCKSETLLVLVWLDPNHLEAQTKENKHILWIKMFRVTICGREQDGFYVDVFWSYWLMHMFHQHCNMWR